MRRCLIALLALVVAAHVSRAQGTAVVPPGDVAYADLDRLNEMGFLDSLIVGQRPYSRREFARIVRVAQDRLNSRGRSWGEHAIGVASATLARLQERFGSDAGPNGDSSLELLDGFGVTLGSTDAQRRTVSAENRGRIETTIDPLARRRLGEPAPAGKVANLELAHRVEPADWLAIQVSERFEARSPDDTTISRNRSELLTLFARARVRNLALSVGREAFAWSQHAGDGLFLASDAPALDQVSLSSDAPFHFTGLLHHLGGAQGTIILADLGPSLHHSDSRLLVYKLSIQPSSALELGGTFMNHFGGAGARSASFTDRFIDFLPFIDIFRTHNYVDSSRTLDVESDKLLGLDGRLRLHALGDMTISGELLLDDFDVHRLQSLLTTTASQYVNVIFPRLGDDALSLRLSAKHMGILTYTHTQLSDGITSRGRLLGDELGPDAKSFGAEIGWTPSEERTIGVELRRAIYSSATYTQFYSDPGQTYSVVKKVSSDPDETRDRLMVSIALKPDAFWVLSLRGGYEQTSNFSWIVGATRHDYVAEIALRFAQ